MIDGIVPHEKIKKECPQCHTPIVLQSNIELVDVTEISARCRKCNYYMWLYFAYEE